MNKPIYCYTCKRKLSTNFLINLITKVKIYDFDEGSYCEKCAKLIVDIRRKGGFDL